MNIIEAENAEKLRKSAMDEIARRREIITEKKNGRGAPYDRLLEISREIMKEAGEDAMPKEESFQLAIERNPLLFQIWQDSLPPGASSLKDSPRPATVEGGYVPDPIERIVEAAAVELTHKLGSRPDFQTAWDYANDEYPEAFAMPPPVVKAAETKSVTPSEQELRIQVALGHARHELGEDATFQAIWERARETDPLIFE